MTPVQHALTPKLLDALYTESMILADEARSYFDRDPVAAGLEPAVAVAFSCESLKVTTRLMHSIAWLLNQKAYLAGELSSADRQDDSRDLGYAPASDHFLSERFPGEAQDIIRASEEFYYRLQRVNAGMRTQHSEIPEPIKLRQKIMQAF